LGAIAKVPETTTCRVFPNARGKEIAQRRVPTTAVTKDDIQLLYEYDRWANNRVLHAVSTLSAEEFTRDEREQVEFVNRVTNESLRRMLPVRETQISLVHLLQHLANHSTHHRGQVALRMRQLAAKPLATDFAMFLMEGRRGRADAQ
jgi:uncharacterized damage-inducible protein DinB